MSIISKTLELGPDQTTILRPNNSDDSFELTAIITEVDVGIRFEDSNGTRTTRKMINAEETAARIFVDGDTNIVLDSDKSARSTVFLSMVRHDG